MRWDELLRIHAHVIRDTQIGYLISTSEDLEHNLPLHVVDKCRLTQLGGNGKHTFFIYKVCACGRFYGCLFLCLFCLGVTCAQPSRVPISLFTVRESGVHRSEEFTITRCRLYVFARV